MEREGGSRQMGWGGVGSSRENAIASHDEKM
jgi:hypothetical protein